MRGRVVIWIILLLLDKVHDFVLSFAGTIGVGENDLNVLPARVVVQPVVDVVAKTLGELVHEGRAGSDAVRVEVLLLGVVLGQRAAASDDLLLDPADVGSTLGAFLGRAKSTTSLLIHLRARSL